MILIPTYPCKNCKNRKLYCHASCKEYIQYAQRQAEGRLKDKLSRRSSFADDSYGYYSEAEKKKHKGLRG